jgi:hypothetical protein
MDHPLNLLAHHVQASPTRTFSACIILYSSWLLRAAALLMKSGEESTQTKTVLKTWLSLRGIPLLFFLRILLACGRLIFRLVAAQVAHLLDH